MLKAKEVESKGSGVTRQEPVDSGTYPARILQIVDLGYQKQKPFQGIEKDPQNALMITYELLDEFCLDEDGNEMEDKPRVISEDFPLHNPSADKAKSTNRYKALDPDEKFDWDFSKLLGLPCDVTLTQNVTPKMTYVNVQSISAMRPKDAKKAGDLVNTPVVLDLSDPDVDVFNALPEWVQTRIKGGLDFEGSLLDNLLNEEEPEEDDKNTDEEDW